MRYWSFYAHIWGRQEIRRAYAILEEESKTNKSEREVLRKDFDVLLNNFERLKADLEKIKGKYIDSLHSTRKSEEQINLIKGLGETIGTYIKKIFENLEMMDDKKKDD